MFGLEIFHYSHAAKNKALDAAKETKSVTVTRPDTADPNVWGESMLHGSLALKTDHQFTP